MSILRVSDLSVRLKSNDQILVDSVSFEIERATSLVLLGQSGCGKTMTCNAVMDLLNPYVFDVTGSIVFDDIDLMMLDPKTKRSIFGKDIAFIPQNPMTAFDPSMKIGRQMDETLKLHSDIEKTARSEIITDALISAGLKDTRSIISSYPYMLSGGMLQRVVIAMTRMLSPKLIIADEPTTALDVIHRNSTVDSFASIRDSGAAVLFVTHDFVAARRLGGQVMVMREGSILESGDIQEVYADPHESYTRALIEAVNLIKEDQLRA